INENPSVNNNLIKDILEKSSDAKLVVIQENNNSNSLNDDITSKIYKTIKNSNELKDEILKLSGEIITHTNLKSKDRSVKKTFDQEKNKIRELIIGESESIKKLDDIIERASDSSINVLITGETGTGKELVAKCIHINSNRNKHPIITVNMAAIPHDLLESELFGHEKGAFTGAIGQRIGKFEQASGGSIFLDEIGEMDFNLQAKLLRVLQEKELVRIGGNKTIKINCRVITATNKNLQDEVSEGNFREDLYYRLYGLCIHLPPLRERRKDKILIAKFIIENYCRENNLKPVKLSDDAVNKLSEYTFPGNIRELKSCIEIAIVMSNGSEIKADDIQFNNHLNIKKLISEEKSLAEYEREIIRFFLSRYNQNVIKVADRLQIGKSTIYRMIKENTEFFEE
ncbi:MAG: sigma-54 interaction domain-containing protein, partial [Bacteroidota bacterium]